MWMDSCFGCDSRILSQMSTSADESMRRLWVGVLTVSFFSQLFCDFVFAKSAYFSLMLDLFNGLRFLPWFK